MPKKLFLIDAFALVYRSYFAFSKNPRRTSQGLDTSAIFGFTNTLLQVLKREKPAYIGACFDTQAPTFRHKMQADYKANRQAQPEGITEALPYVKKLLQSFQIAIFERDGYEADDVIGTLANSLASDQIHVYIMTSDKDFGQLVSDNIWLYKPAFMKNPAETWGVAEVLDKWQIEKTEQVIDMLGLQGDSVDNIPGIPGVGPKTAQRFIKKYRSIENLLANTQDLKGKEKQNLEKYAEQALLSKQLATIRTDVPLDFSLEKLRSRDLKSEEVKALFELLEFRTLARRLLGNKKVHSKSRASELTFFKESTGDSLPNQTMPQPNNYYTLRHFYHAIAEEEVEALGNYLTEKKRFAFALETQRGKINGIAIAAEKREAYYLPVAQYAGSSWLSTLKLVFESEGIIKIGMAIKDALKVFFDYDIRPSYELPCCFFDVEILHYILQAHQRHDLKDITKHYINYALSEDMEKGRGDEYCERADILLSLYESLWQEIQNQKLEQVYETLDAPLLFTLANMEREGVCIDTRDLRQYAAELSSEIQSIEKAIAQEVGTKFNLDSAKQLGVVLFEKLKLMENPKKTKTGQYATGEDILITLAKDHAIAKHLLEYRQLKKLKSAYVDALPDWADEQNLIHTSFQQTVTVTGRLSSANPNLQNIPIRSARGKRIRKAFIPRDSEYSLMSVDYSQMELRILAWLSEDPSLLNVFKNNEDIHTSTAAQLFEKKKGLTADELRRRAKAVNFGIIYGISAFGLSKQLQIPRRESEAIIQAYFERFPKVKNYMESVLEFCRDKGYVKTAYGRRRYIPDITSRNFTVRSNAERNAVNTCVQGTAADIMKTAMVAIATSLSKNKLRSKLTMQIHDELVLEVFQGEESFLFREVRRLMEVPLGSLVDAKVHIGLGKNWFEAHQAVENP